MKLYVCSEKETENCNTPCVQNFSFFTLRMLDFFILLYYKKNRNNKQVYFLFCYLFTYLFIYLFIEVSALLMMQT